MVFIFPYRALVSSAAKNILAQVVTHVGIPVGEKFLAVVYVYVQL